MFGESVKEIKIWATEFPSQLILFFFPRSICVVTLRNYCVLLWTKGKIRNSSWREKLGRDGWVREEKQTIIVLQAKTKVVSIATSRGQCVITWLVVVEYSFTLHQPRFRCRGA